MLRKMFIFATFVMCFNFFSSPAYCDIKPVSFELRFVCEEPSPDCDKMLDNSSQKELYLQKQVQFSFADLKKAAMQVQWSPSRNYGSNEKSLMGGAVKSSSEPEAKISLTFTDESTKRLVQVTTDNVNKRLGIILDGKMIMAPNIREPITSGEVEITGLTISKSYAEDFVYRINKALGVETQEQPSADTPQNGYLGLISVMLGLLLGWGAIKSITIAFPKVGSIVSGSSLKDSVVFLFTNVEMQKRIIVTIGVVVFIQLVSTIHVFGIDKSVLREFIERIANLSGGKLPNASLAFQKLSIMSLGLAPFFSACILLQLLSGVTPGLKKLYYSEKTGRQVLTRHTYILTIVLTMIQAYFISLWMESPSAFGGMPIVASPGISFQILTVVTLTAAVAALFFIADLINRYGIGNGIAVIVVSYLLPTISAAFEVTYQLFQLVKLSPIAVLVLTALFVTLVYLAFCLTRYCGTVEVQNNKGDKIQIPLRPTIVGKQPLKLAESIFLFPVIVVSFMHLPSLQHILISFQNNIIIYLIVIAVLTIFLVYLYTAMVFDLEYTTNLITKYGYSFENNVEALGDYLDETMTKVLIWTGVALVSTALLTKLCMVVFKTPLLTANLFSAGFLLVFVGVFSDIISQAGFFKEKFESGIKEWAVCYVAFDEIEATVKSSFLKDNGILALVEPLRFTWGLPTRTMVDQYRLYVPLIKNEEAKGLLDRS